MMACHQLAEEKCQAIFKPKDDTNYFTLGSEFILFADDNCTILVKRDFLTSLGKYEWTKSRSAEIAILRNLRKTKLKQYKFQFFGARNCVHSLSYQSK